MRICPDCQTLLEDQATFCDNCGLRLDEVEKSPMVSPEDDSLSLKKGQDKPSRLPDESPQSLFPGTCSVCGYINMPGEMFCQNCGVQLAPVVSSPPPLPTPVSKPTTTPEEGEATAADDSMGACAHCGYDNLPGETYCQNCGVLLKTSTSVPTPSEAPVPSPPPEIEKAEIGQEVHAEVMCPYCGFTNRAGEAYCNNCGLQLSMPSVPIKSTVGEVSPLTPRTTTPSSDYSPVDEDKPVNIEEHVRGRLIVQDTGDEIDLPSGKPELLIGRLDHVRNIYPDVDLTSYAGETFGVSRKHARLVAQGAQVFIEDLNSTNFTFLNKQMLQPGQRYLLKHGDEIRIGLLALLYLTN